MKEKTAIKLNKFWEYGGKLQLTPLAPYGKVYFMKEKYWKLLSKKIKLSLSERKEDE